MSDNTQLTTTENYNKSNITFSKPETNTIPNSEISFKRIKIGMKNQDGTYGDLIIKTSQLFSFGVQENKDMKTQEINGYSMPLCMWNKDGCTSEEKDLTDLIDNIVDVIKKHLLKTRDDFGMYDLEMSDLKKFNPLYWKRERGKIIEGRGPTLYPKLIISKKKGNKILSSFYDVNTDEQLDALSLKGKYCYVECAIKIESIFIGNKPSLQIKLTEGIVRTLDSKAPRLLRPKAETVVSVSKNVTDSLQKLQEDNEDSDEDSDGSISEEETKPKKVKKRVIKKR